MFEIAMPIDQAMPIDLAIQRELDYQFVYREELRELVGKHKFGNQYMRLRRIIRMSGERVKALYKYKDQKEPFIKFHT